MMNNNELMNVTIHDNGACFMVCVNGLAVQGFNTLAGAWRHIDWMYRVATQRFTVGENKTPVLDWIRGMNASGFMDFSWVEQIDG